MIASFGGNRVVWRIAWAWVALLLAAAPARANTAVVVPPTVDVACSPDTVEQATTELMRLLRVQGFDVISPGQASAVAEDAQQSGGFPRETNPQECRTADCATDYRRLFDASFAVHLRLSGSAGAVRSVSVEITESPEASFGQSAPVQGGDLKGAVRTAYEAAREKHLRGEGPWLSVAGEPEGAFVYLDGLEMGRIPFERRFVKGGKHRLEVRADGYISQASALEIPSLIDHEERVKVVLAPLHGQPVAARKLNRTWDYVVGSLIAAAGAVHLAVGIQQFRQRDECATHGPDGMCTRVYGDDQGVSQEKLFLGLGAGGIALGGLWMGVAPIGRLRARASRDTAQLTFTSNF